VFTSGGTEADNLALRGVTKARRGLGDHLVVSAIEHHAVLDTARDLESSGQVRLSVVAVDRDGRVDPAAVAAAIGSKTTLVSVMHANNEIGTVQPIAELSAIARERRAVFHTDAVQSAGKIPIDIKALGVDLLSMSAHKFYGPKGVGALWIRRGVRLQTPLTGGKQERSRRAGTENVSGIAGMGVAAREARAKMVAEATRLAALRDRLEDGILCGVTGTVLNGVRSPRVPNTTNISFDRTEAESLLIALDLEGIAVSTGSACSSGTLEPSHVLKAMGFPAHRTQNSIRFSLGSANSEAEIDRVIAVLPGIVEKLRSLTRAPARV
jgi:cysteine desulfurase